MPVDEQRLNAFLGKAVADLGAAVSAVLVCIGDELGFYKALAAGPLTASELAKKTSTNERYVREWLANQAAGGYVEYDAATQQFSLSPEQAPPPAAPVFLLHGAEDNVIPSVETVLLANYLHGKTEVHAVLSGLITHAEVDKSAAAVEVWRLVGFWKALMSH